MVLRAFHWYGEHVFFYSFVAGLPFALLGGQDALATALMMGTFFCLAWFSINAIVVCTGTAIQLRKEGKPLFEAGGMTEYDAGKCKRIGEEVAKAIRENR